MVGEAFPDPLQFKKTSPYFDEKATKTKPRWFAREMKCISHYPRVLTLAELRAAPALAHMKLLQQGSRLSVTPVTKSEYDTILKLLKISP